MGKSYTSVIVHIIFHVKHVDCLLKESDLPQIYQYIGGIVRAVSGYSYTIGGMPDHIHILASIPSAVSLSDFVRKIKAGTSKWIKGLSPDYKDFAWQEGYGAFSVSESQKMTVINYIKHQKEHHRTFSANEEFNRFLEKHGWSPFS